MNEGSGLGACGSGQNNKKLEDTVLVLIAIETCSSVTLLSSEPRVPSPEPRQ
jgi:hypothetical protein